MKKLVIASDHGGFALKEKLKPWLIKQGYSLEDVGAINDTPSDHPTFAKKVAQKVLAENAFGILICGTGIGMCQTANRYKGIYATMAHNETFAELSRLHNNSNVLCLAGRFISFEKAKKITKTFLDTDFLGGHYTARVNMLDV